MNRPHVTINCAMSADGKIALPNRKQLRISCDEDIKRMYNLRNEVDAVLVGIETILSDDPKLTVKKSYIKNPKQPLRVVLDTKFRIPNNALVLNNSAKTLILTGNKNKKNIESENIDVVECKIDLKGHIDIICALDLLYKRGVKKLLVEGGSRVIWNFLKEKTVDDLFIYIRPFIIGGKDTPTIADGDGIKNEDKLVLLKIIEVKRFGEGILIHYKMV